MVLKKCLVGAVHPLHNILNRLRPKLIPPAKAVFLQLCYVLHQPIGRKMLAIQLIVAPVEGNTVVPDGGSRVDGSIQMAVPLAAVQLILIGFYHFHGYASSLKSLYLLYHFEKTGSIAPYIPMPEGRGFTAQLII